MILKITYLWYYLIIFFIETAITIFEICYLKTNNKKSIMIISCRGCDYEACPLKASFQIKNVTDVSNK